MYTYVCNIAALSEYTSEMIVIAIEVTKVYVWNGSKQDENDQDDEGLNDDGSQKKAKSAAKIIKSKRKWMVKRVKNVVKFISGEKNKPAAQRAEEQSSTATATAETAETELPMSSEDHANHAKNNENGGEVLLGLSIDNLSFAFFLGRRREGRGSRMKEFWMPNSIRL